MTDAIPNKIVDGVLVPFDANDLAQLAMDTSFTVNQTAKSTDVDTKRDSALYGGFTVPSSASTTLVGKVLQTRAEDQINWLTSQAAYGAAVAGGEGATQGASFRAQDNSTTIVSFSEGLAVLLAMAGWGQAIFARSWALKDAIKAAGNQADLDTVDISTGWPG